MFQNTLQNPIIFFVPHRGGTIPNFHPHVTYDLLMTQNTHRRQGVENPHHEEVQEHVGREQNEDKDANCDDLRNCNSRFPFNREIGGRFWRLGQPVLKPFMLGHSTRESGGSLLDWIVTLVHNFT